MKLFFRHKEIILILILGFLAGYPLLHGGLHPTHDGEYHVIRFYEFDKVLRSGDIYPRWAPDLNKGYGIPLFNYVYPLPNYLASFLHLFGFSFIDAFKLQLFLGLIMSGFFFFLWSRIFWGRTGGFVASIFYMYSPYHILDIYIRGSVGEVWAFVFAPGLLWAITKLWITGKLRFSVLTSIFLALLIFSHNILALMFFVFTVFYTLLLYFQYSRVKNYLSLTLRGVFFGICLSSVFWLPAMFERKFVSGLDIYNVHENFPEVFQLLVPSWGSGFSGESIADQMSFQIGLANIIVIFFSLFLYSSFAKKTKQRNLIAFFLVCFFVTVFLMLKFSLVIWENVPLMIYFQFPWRFLSLTILITSFIAGSLVYFFEKNRILKTIILSMMIAGTVVLSHNYTKPAYYHDRTDEHYIRRENFIGGTNSPGDLFNTVWFNASLKRRENKFHIVGNGSVEREIIAPTKYVLTADLLSDSKVVVNTAYFPGWKVFVSGKESPLMPDKDGLISFDLPTGKSNIEMFFDNTSVRELGFVISMASVLFFIIMIAKVVRYNSAIKNYLKRLRVLLFSL